MQLVSSNYAGTGASQSIVGLGFTPIAVIIKGGNNIAQLCTNTMGADQTKPLTGSTALQTNRVTSLDSNGFTVGTDAQCNASGTTYYYLAFGDDGAGDIATSSYAGNNTDDHDITTVGFQPDLVIVASATTNAVMHSTSTMGADTTQGFDTASFSNRIQAMLSNGFQVGTNATVNSNLVTYYYLCLKAAANRFSVLNYTGDSNDDRSVTGAGFQPDNAWTKRANGSTAPLRVADLVGDTSLFFDTTVAAANLIQAFQADGFQLGNNLAVNGSATYNAVFFKASGTSFDPSTSWMWGQVGGAAPVQTPVGVVTY